MAHHEAPPGAFTFPRPAAGSPQGSRRAHSIEHQLACKPGSVWSCLRDGHSSGTPIAGRLEQPTRMAGLETGLQAGFLHLPAIPIWSCTGWGLPCRRRYRSRGALLPHRFTLTFGPKPSGGLFSVALSLGSPPAAVNRHPVSMEPGLSSTARFERAITPRAAATVQPTDPS